MAGVRFVFSAPFVRIWFVALAATGAGFQLFPTAPFRLRELGAPEAAAGWFLGCLTYGSALAAAWTGALGDLLGRRRVLFVAALMLAATSALYALVTSWKLFVLLAIPHGVVWSSLLTAGNSELMRIAPAARRAEAIAYYGMAGNLSIATAPALGFWLLEWSWGALCASLTLLHLAIAVLSLRLDADGPLRADLRHRLAPHRAVDWRTLLVAGALLLVSIGYGGLTSFVALYSEEHGIAPRGIFFTGFAVTIIAVRPLLAPFIDRRGARRLLPISIVACAVGVALIPFQSGRTGLIGAAVVFGLGFAVLGPAFTSWAVGNVDPERRGAAFGALLAAFDLGIGLGSVGFGIIIAYSGYRAAFVGAALLGLLAWPYLVWSERRAGFGAASREGSALG